MPVAVLAALVSALSFALAAALQQREALKVNDSGVADLRLLGRLGRRPWWWAGVGFDIVSMALHVTALSFATLAVVQPLGVMGIVFAVPMVALLRRQRMRGLDIAAVAAISVGLIALLSSLPATSARPDFSSSAVGCAVAFTMAAMALATVLGHRHPGRPRAILLAAGAGTAFGMTAVLVRALLLLIRQPGTGVTIVVVACSILAVGLGGYLLLQSAYRCGHFAASLATSTVMNPVVAVLAGGMLLREALPTAPVQLLVIAAGAVLICGGIAQLVRSPAVLDLAPHPATARPAPDHFVPAPTVRPALSLPKAVERRRSVSGT